MLMDEHGMKEGEAFTFIQRTAMSERIADARRRRADHRRDAAPGPTRLAADSMKLLLLDGNSLTYRAFFALPTDMATASGQVTNAVFGFTSMFINLLKDQQPDGVLVAFDRPEPRSATRPTREYKANARRPPTSSASRWASVREVLDALGVHVVDLAGWRPTTSSPRSPSRPRPMATR